MLKLGAGIAAKGTKGSTPLMWAAACSRNQDVIVALLQAGAALDAAGGDGMTPLHWAAAYSAKPEILIALLNAGADAKVRDAKSRTAAYYARRNENLKDTEAYRQLRNAAN